MQWFIVMILCWSLAASGCAQKHPPVITAHGDTSPHTEAAQRPVRQQLLEHHNTWRGTPHRQGGSSRAGVDCSAYTQITFRRQFNIELPRSTREQRKTGKPVSRSRLAAGDLVFFRTGWNSGHVGVYIGDGTFIHTSSSKGVTRTSMESPYWRKRYRSARRVLFF